MALPIIPVPTFPNVPNLPGVPPLLRNVAASIPPIIQPLLADIPGVGALLTGTDWGIFDVDGTAIVEADSCVSVEIVSEYRIADYPIEGGGFESYNKVKAPYDARVRLARGGSQSQREAFIAQLGAVLASLDGCVVATPEKTYLNANVVHVDIARTARQGATLISADVWLREVRSVAAPSFSTPSQPSAASAHDDGNVPPFDSSLPGLPESPI